MTGVPGGGWFFSYWGNGATGGSFNGATITVNGGFSGTLSVTVPTTVGTVTNIVGNVLPTNTSTSMSGPSTTVYLFFYNSPGSYSATGGSTICYCAGTEIATPEGPRKIETLAPGDTLCTADGGTTTVRWLGRQTIEPRFRIPEEVNPVCITRGALGNGTPVRDLYVSPDHAIAVDDFLINAMALVNGDTIYQVEDVPLDGFVYYHVETDAHELILAEGAAAETFVDYVDRGDFDNDREYLELYGCERIIPEMNRVRISSRQLVPHHLRERLAPPYSRKQRTAA